ncbi:hypothetical protein DW903_18740 [Ruminococcus sp. AM42-10AC]|nr:hypothetical protein DW903_18740 [Ruminococcus sp. AM42-10AC]
MLDNIFEIETGEADFGEAATSSVSPILWNGHYYTIYDSSMDWESAKKYCKKQGGHLVTITSKEEQEKICSQP